MARCRDMSSHPCQAPYHQGTNTCRIRPARSGTTRHTIPCTHDIRQCLNSGGAEYWSDEIIIEKSYMGNGRFHV